jgi:hypothetical protein
MKTVFILLFLLDAAMHYAHPGVGIVMDSKGNVYYTDLSRVWKIDTRGKNQLLFREFIPMNFIWISTIIS